MCIRFPDRKSQSPGVIHNAWLNRIARQPLSQAKNYPQEKSCLSRLVKIISPVIF